jgi:hypothetical protein
MLASRPPLVPTPELAQASSFPPSPAPSVDPAARPIPVSSDSAWSVLPRSVRPSEAELLATFLPFVVSNDTPFRRVLYSWTTKEQAAALRRDRRLLLKGSQDTPFSAYDAGLWQSYNQDRLARLLFNPPFLMHRYAWVSAWATRFSADARPYGDELIRITLKEDALVVAFFPGAPAASRWAVFDLRGQRLTEAEGLKKASKIGAVYHVHRTQAGEPTFREFIVCNEAMVESWALATDDLKEQLRKEQQALDIWRRSQLDGRPSFSPQEVLSWQAGIPDGSWATAPSSGREAIYESALAFATERYTPTTINADELLASLASLKIEGPALEHRPGLPEPRIGPLPAALPTAPPKKVCFQGTMVGEKHCHMEERNVLPCRKRPGSDRLVLAVREGSEVS